MSHAPLTQASQLDDLDRNEVVEGYYDGLAGDMEPGENRTVAYWHGWRNGMTDGGHMEKDAAQAALARSVVESQRTNPG